MKLVENRFYTGGPIPEPLEREIEPILENLSTQAEVLAMTWCLDHYIPLVYHAEMTGTCPWSLVPYERLVRHDSQELRRITQALGLEMTTEMKESLPEPSSSVKDTLPDDRDRQLSKLNRRLSSQQIDDILSIVDSMGLSSIWTSDVEPNYSLLNELQWAKYQW